MLSETPNESKQIRKDVVYAERTEPYRSAATVDHTPNCEVLRHFAIDGLLLDSKKERTTGHPLGQVSSRAICFFAQVD